MVYNYELEFVSTHLWNWEEGQLGTLKITYPQKTRNKPETHNVEMEVTIPMLYVQLIDQLCAEVDHSRFNNAHEALRRAGYAADVLQHLGKELKMCKYDGASFRSKVLNPILQRYLKGIHDAYAPVVQEAVAQASAEVENFLNIKKGNAEDDKVTILGATVFYLSEDPLDTKNIPYYRRNLVYLPEARWHATSSMTAPIT